MKTSSLPISLLAALLFLTGCASNPFAAAKKAGIHTVQLMPVEYGDMRYGMDVTKLDDPFGAARTDMMNDVGQDGLRRMQKLMQKHHMDVPRMIYDRVKLQLQNQPDLTLVPQSPADGMIAVKIVQYGFTDMPFTLMHEIPFVMVQAELRDKNGHKIWTRKSKLSLPAEDDAGASWDDYESHPEELRDEWNAQVIEAVIQLIPYGE